jgi:hypothetical protein
MWGIPYSSRYRVVADSSRGAAEAVVGATAVIAVARARTRQTIASDSRADRFIGISGER